MEERLLVRTPLEVSVQVIRQCRTMHLCELLIMVMLKAPTLRLSANITEQTFIEIKTMINLTRN